MNRRINQWTIAVVLIVFAIGVIHAAEVINLAPMIREIPDMYIGDAENASGMNVFVLPDAVGLNGLVKDDHTSASGIRWSYASQGGVYLINGVEPVDPAIDDLVSPPADKSIELNHDPMDPTTGTLGNRTITFRDNLRSPITEAGGRGPYSDRFGSSHGEWNSPGTVIDSRVLTLFASDGSTVSLANAASFVVYTVDNGYDFVSYRCCAQYNFDFRNDHHGWNYELYGGSASSQTNGGLCICGRRFGKDDAVWIGAYPVVTLRANTAYELTATITTSNANPNATPMWAIVYDNYGGSGVGQNEYGGETFFLDNVGGANSPIAGVGRSEFIHASDRSAQRHARDFPDGGPARHDAWKRPGDGLLPTVHHRGKGSFRQNRGGGRLFR